MERKFLILLVAIAIQFQLNEGRTCYSYDYTKPRNDSSSLDTIRCEHKNQWCFSVYNVASNGTSQVLQKGCWLNDNGCSLTNECVFRKLGRPSSMYFCCCAGDLCNSSIPPKLNYTDSLSQTKPRSPAKDLEV